MIISQDHPTEERAPRNRTPHVKVGGVGIGSSRIVRGVGFTYGRHFKTLDGRDSNGFYDTNVPKEESQRNREKQGTLTSFSIGESHAPAPSVRRTDNVPLFFPIICGNYRGIPASKWVSMLGASPQTPGIYRLGPNPERY